MKHDIPSPPLGGSGQGEGAGKFMIHNWLYRTTALLLAATAVTLAHAQTPPSGSTQGYPAKPVRMLVAFPAGGSADIVARVIAQRLSEQVGPEFHRGQPARRRRQSRVRSALARGCRRLHDPQQHAGHRHQPASLQEGRVQARGLRRRRTHRRSAAARDGQSFRSREHASAS